MRPTPTYHDRNSLIFFSPGNRMEFHHAMATVMDPRTPCGIIVNGEFVCCTDSGPIGVPDRKTCCDNYGPVYCSDGTRRCDGESCEGPPPQLQVTGRGGGGAGVTGTGTATGDVIPTGGGDDPLSNIWNQIRPMFEGNCDWIPGTTLPVPCGFIVVGGVAALLIAFAVIRK